MMPMSTFVRVFALLIICWEKVDSHCRFGCLTSTRLFVNNVNIASERECSKRFDMMTLRPSGDEGYRSFSKDIKISLRSSSSEYPFGLMQRRDYERILTGKDKFFLYVKSLGDLVPQSSLFKWGINGLVPIAATIGYFATPSRFHGVKASGSFVFAVLATLLKMVKVKERKKLAPNALVGLIMTKGPSRITWEDLMDAGKDFCITEAELKAMSLQLYASVLRRIVSNRRQDFSELEHIILFKNMLKLEDGDALVNCHLAVLGEHDRGESSIDVQKLVYLTERMYNQDGKVSKMYVDQCVRLRAQLGGISQVELLQRVCDYAKPLYQDTLTQLLERPNQFSAEMLLKMRRRVGISEVVAGGMHLDSYQKKIQALLKSKNKLDETDRVDLAKLRGVMGVSQFEGERTLQSVTAPIYREALTSALQNAMNLQWGDPELDTLRQKLKDCQLHLLLSQGAVDIIMKETIRKITQQYLDSALSAIKNTSGTAGPDIDIVSTNIKSILRLKDIVHLLLQSEPDTDTSKYFTGILISSPSARLSNLDKQEIYRCFMSACLSDGSIAEEDKASLWELSEMLELDEEDGYSVYLTLVRPIVASKLATMAESSKNWDSPEVTRLAEGLAIPASLFADMLLDAYATQLEKYLLTNGRVLSDSAKIRLADMASVLNLSTYQVERIHDKAYETVFLNSVLFSMQDMLDSYENNGKGDGNVGLLEGPLEALRQELGMSREGAKEGFLEGFNQFIGPKWVSVYSAVQDAIQEGLEGTKDAAFRDLIELLSLCERTGVMREICLADGTPQSEYSGISSIANAQAEELYVFLLDETFRYTGQSDTLNRAIALLNKLETLSTVLGMCDDQLRDIHKREGIRLFTTYVTTALEYAWQLTTVDTTFLKFLQDSLSLTPVICDEIVSRSKKFFLRAKISEIVPLLPIGRSMESIAKDSALSAKDFDVAETCRRIRESAVTMGIKLHKDLNISEELRKSVFVAEISPLLVNEGYQLLKTTNREMIETIRKDLGLPEEAINFSSAPDKVNVPNQK